MMFRRLTAPWQGPLDSILNYPVSNNFSRNIVKLYVALAMSGLLCNQRRVQYSRASKYHWSGHDGQRIQEVV